MTFKEKIIEDRNSALKIRDKELSALLCTVVGELDRQGKYPSDEIVLRTIKKMSESCKECGNFKDSQILEKYLPKLMNEEELTTKIKEIVCNENLTKNDLGKVMKILKDQYANLYDGRMASQIASNILI